MFLLLLLIFIVTIFLCYVRFYWSRRNFYKMAEQFVGPPTLPIIGNTLMFLNLQSRKLLKPMTHQSILYKSPMKIWILHRLMLLVYDPVNLETIFNHPDGLEKDPYMYKFALEIPDKGIHTLFTAPVPIWRKLKKIILPTFNQKILNGYVDIFSEKSNILVNQLQKHAGKGTFDVFQHFALLTIDAIFPTLMGMTYNAQTEEVELGAWLESFMRIIFDRMSYKPLYYFDFIFKMTADGKLFYAMIENIRERLRLSLGETIKNYRRERRENPEAPVEEVKVNSFLRQLIVLSEEGLNLSDTQIMQEGMLLFLAGTDTVSTTASFVLLMLGMHPEVQEKVYQEVIDTIGFEKSVEHTDLPKLTYTEMVIKETMRIYPAGPVTARAATGDILLTDGRVIPKGTTMAIGVIHAHRNPEVWPDPLKFDPLRFLPEECAKRHLYSYIPFLAGPRYCIGSKFAMMLMKTVIATVVRKFSVKTCYDRMEDIKVKQSVALKPINGFLVSIEERKF